MCAFVQLLCVALHHVSATNAAVNLEVSCNISATPLLTKKFQAYTSGIVALDRIIRDAYLLRPAGATYMRVDVGLGWTPNTDHRAFPGIFNTVIKDQKLDHFDFSAVKKLSQSLHDLGVTPVYAWAYNPFSIDYKSAPTNLSQWRELHRRLAAGLRTQGYPAIHELYNEPDLNWAFTGSWSDYLQMAIAASEGLRDGDPDARIIGPAMAIPSADKLDAFLSLVSNGTIPLHALSIHAYGQPIIGPWQTNLVLAQKALDKAKLSSLPIYINELNPLGPSDPNRKSKLSSYTFAAVAMDTMSALLEHDDLKMVNWAQFLDSGFGDGWGLVAENGHLKPAYHAFYLYARMPPQRRQLRQQGGEGMVVGFASSNASLVSVSVWSRSSETMVMHLVIRDLPFPVSQALVRVYCVDSTHNNESSTGFIQPLTQYYVGREESNSVGGGVRRGGGGVRWEGEIGPFAVMHFEVTMS